MSGRISKLKAMKIVKKQPEVGSTWHREVDGIGITGGYMSVGARNTAFLD